VDYYLKFVILGLQKLCMLAFPSWHILFMHIYAAGLANYQCSDSDLPSMSGYCGHSVFSRSFFFLFSSVLCNILAAILSICDCISTLQVILLTTNYLLLCKEVLASCLIYAWPLRPDR